MEQSTSKRRKVTTTASDEAAQITDPRFANIQSDPRYRLPSKKHKVKLDKRFARALQDDDFSRKARVDRYGRPLDTRKEKQELKRKYEFDEDESDQPDDDDSVQKELKAAKQSSRDLLREGKDSGTSSSDSSSDDASASDDEIEEEAELAPQTQADVPTGEVSSRLAVVNLDWDNIRSQDLMAVFSSFLETTGQLNRVAIYPSEYGKERMQREEMEGPPAEIFADEEQTASESDGSIHYSEADEEDEEAIKKSLLQSNETEDFNSSALRAYQLTRLRYYYAVLFFSSPNAAKHIYDSVDGTEYLSTANFFDLRFVPDNVDFSHDEPREDCTSIPEGYKPNDFVTDALQHSRVKLTWDAEDNGRKEAQARVFRGSRKEVEEADLAIYLGSDSSSNEEEDVGEAPEPGSTNQSTTKKDGERAKMRSLLGLSSEPTTSSKSKDKAPLGGVQVTFSAGLTAANASGEKRSVFENSPEPDETTLEKYVRKERERKQSRKEKLKSTPSGAEADTPTADAPDSPNEDSGFEDDFFATADPSKPKQSSSKQRKEDRLRRKAEREAEEAQSLAQKAQLEHLLDPTGDGEGVRHFDMKEIERDEKTARKAAKKVAGKKAERNRAGKNAVASVKANSAEEGREKGFEIPTNDARFASRLFENHEYAIDPTNPRYKETKAMKALMEEGRRRKGKKQKEGDREERNEKRGDAEDVKQLVEKLKRRKV